MAVKTWLPYPCKTRGWPGGGGDRDRSTRCGCSAVRFETWSIALGVPNWSSWVAAGCSFNVLTTGATVGRGVTEGRGGATPGGDLIGVLCHGVFVITLTVPLS